MSSEMNDGKSENNNSNSLEKINENECISLKRQRIDIENDSQEINNPTPEKTCILCFENPSENKKFMENHQCQTCKKDAWSICICCNETLLSRACPICRSNYAPIVLYSVPGEPLTKLADRSLDSDEKSFMLYKFGIIHHLIAKSNLAIWVENDKKMHFSLPVEITSDTSNLQIMNATIDLDNEKLKDGVFEFNNDIWDLIENESEKEETTSGEIRNYHDATQWILSFTKRQDHKIFTMMSPDDWTFMLDSNESKDIIDTLQIIKQNLVLKKN